MSRRYNLIPRNVRAYNQNPPCPARTRADEAQREQEATSADADIARRDNATNRQAMAEYIAGLDANSPHADIARRDAANDERLMAEYMNSLWLADAETMQAEYRDEADTLASLLAY